MLCWDEAKYLSNIEKHKISFDLAGILLDNITVEVTDTRRNYGEERINAYGYIGERLFVCCHTPRCGWRHLISMRKASPKEVKNYG